MVLPPEFYKTRAIGGSAVLTLAESDNWNPNKCTSVPDLACRESNLAAATASLRGAARHPRVVEYRANLLGLRAQSSL